MKDLYSRWARVLPYAVGAVFAVAVVLLVISVVMFQRASRMKPFLTAPPDDFSREELAGSDYTSMINAVDRVGSSVVTITTYRTRIVNVKARTTREWFLQRAGRIPERRERKYPSFASGVLVNPDGYILTNEHVIRNAEEIIVTLPDSTELQARVKGRDMNFDLALLKIEGSDYPFARLGDSDRLRIGEPVIAVGSPFTYLFNDTKPTVTSGVVSALHRDVRQEKGAKRIFNDMIQIDASINPGNSGGPLVSSDGLVVGINTLIIFGDQNNSNVGMGFAIPSNTARKVMEEIIEYGQVRKVTTGIQVVEIDPELAEELSLDFNRGLLVQQIDREGPGDLAGLKVGDIITGIDGKPVSSLYQANRLIFGKWVGETLNLEVWREDQIIELELVLAELRPSA
ncbi:MAG: trypsin-like serine protease [Candidatus Latescibacteria bacterium]|nr:trypsin-like serine protease [bacterium]MBD3424694.1 trypsin-like serine protease [Candidatus Latescibacterota bacterium]